MNILRATLLTCGVLALSGCTGYESFSEVQALNEAQAVGSPFTQQLASEYKTYANRELKEMFDYPDALHFARKGLAAASGEVVMPEPLVDWDLLPKHIEELGAARGRLIVAFDLGAREIDPATSAVAQARFDCWIEQQEENWQKDDIQGCKSQFLDAMSALEAKLGNIQPPAPPPPVPAPMDVSDAAPTTPMKAEDAMYLVFFDWDKSKLGSGADSVLDAVAQEVKGRAATLKQINIVGHADTSGPKKYNVKLSMRRANTVRDALVARGIDPALIHVDSRGEDEPLVKTADNVREPANRRANISFQ